MGVRCFLLSAVAVFLFVCIVHPSHQSNVTSTWMFRDSTVVKDCYQALTQRGFTTISINQIQLVCRFTFLFSTLSLFLSLCSPAYERKVAPRALALPDPNNTSPSLFSLKTNDKKGCISTQQWTSKAYNWLHPFVHTAPISHPHSTHDQRIHIPCLLHLKLSNGMAQS